MFRRALCDLKGTLQLFYSFFHLRQLFEIAYNTMVWANGKNRRENYGKNAEASIRSFHV